MTTREALHRYIDELPEGALEAAARALAAIADDPVRRALDAAPIDDEPVTGEDLAAIERGHRAVEKGETIPHDVVRRLLDE